MGTHRPRRLTHLHPRMTHRLHPPRKKAPARVCGAAARRSRIVYGALETPKGKKHPPASKKRFAKCFPANANWLARAALPQLGVSPEKMAKVGKTL